MKATQDLKAQIVLHAAICTAIFGVLTVVGIFSSKVHLGFFGFIALFLCGSFFTTVGVVIGDLLRKMAMPDAYFTTGFADSIKKRVFWAVGPQVIGWIIGLIAMNGFMQNILGYDMQRGARKGVANAQLQQTLTEVETEQKAKAVNRPPAPATGPIDPTPMKEAGTFPLIAAGNCVVGLSKQTPQGLVFERPIPIYAQGDTIRAIGSLETFAAFFADGQSDLTGRVRLVYAPGPSADEAKAGQTLGWINAADLEVQDQRNCH